MSSKLITPIFFSFSPLSLQIDTHSSPFDLRAYGAIGSASDFGSEGCRFEPCYARILHSYAHTSTKKVHPPGLEPGSPPWKGGILPLDHECYCIWLFLTLLLFFLLFSFSPLLPFSFIYSLPSIFSEDPIVQMVGHLPYYHSDSRKSLLLRLIDWWEDAGSTPAGIFFFLSLSLPFLPFLIKIPLSPMTWRGEYSSVGRA